VKLKTKLIELKLVDTVRDMVEKIVKMLIQWTAWTELDVVEDQTEKEVLEEEIGAITSQLLKMILMKKIRVKLVTMTRKAKDVIANLVRKKRRLLNLKKKRKKSDSLMKTILLSRRKRMQTFHKQREENTRKSRTRDLKKEILKKKSVSNSSTLN